MRSYVQDDRAASHFILYYLRLKRFPNITHGEPERVDRVEEHLVSLYINQPLVQLRQQPLVGKMERADAAEPASP